MFWGFSAHVHQIHTDYTEPTITTTRLLWKIASIISICHSHIPPMLGIWVRTNSSRHLYMMIMLLWYEQHNYNTESKTDKYKQKKKHMKQIWKRNKQEMAKSKSVRTQGLQQQCGDKPTRQPFIFFFDCENGVCVCEMGALRDPCTQPEILCTVFVLRLVITLSLLNCDVRSHRPKLRHFRSDSLILFLCVAFRIMRLHAHRSFVDRFMRTTRYTMARNPRRVYI